MFKTGDSVMQKGVQEYDKAVTKTLTDTTQSTSWNSPSVQKPINEFSPEERAKLELALEKHKEGLELLSL